MKFKPFSEINAYFRQKLTESSLYTDNDTSFLKIFQHALSYALIEDETKLIRNYMHLPLRMHQSILFVKSRIRRNRSVTMSMHDNVIIDPLRLVKDHNNKLRSVYFDAITSCFGRDSVTLIHKKKSSGITADAYLTNYSRNYSSPDKFETHLLRSIKKVLRKAKVSGAFNENEYRHLLSAFHIFFEEFRFYYQIFKNQPSKRCLFISHYHNEGLIAALRVTGIESIEIQHGLIARNDLYYVYDHAFSKGIVNAFFPDKILVYGQYWKKMLESGCEFNPASIIVAGDYIFRGTPVLQHKREKENTLLLCAQKMMHEEYIRYGLQISKYLDKYKDWKFICKLHPLEPEKEKYETLKSAGFEIVDMEIPLDELLDKSRIQISIYSTTFYDALGHDVVNFSLQNYGNYSDYAADMISEKIAHPLGFSDDPIKRFRQLSDAGLKYPDRQNVYAPFNCDNLKAQLNISSR